MSTTVPVPLDLMQKVLAYIPDTDKDTADAIIGVLSPRANDAGDPALLAQGGYRCGYVDAEGESCVGFVTAYDPTSDTFTVITPGVPGHADISPDEMRVYLSAPPLWTGAVLETLGRD